MATVYEIVQGLSQAAANAYDGALDAKGEPLLVGLQREEGDAILDKRVMDGFNVKFYGNMMCLSYMSEVTLKEVYANGFETRMEEQIAEIVKFLKKEYKKITGEALGLKKKGSLKMGNVQSTSRVRTWVQAHCEYEIQGVTGHDVKDKNDIDSAIKSFLELGKNAKKPENVSITPKANEK